MPPPLYIDVCILVKIACSSSVALTEFFSQNRFRNRKKRQLKRNEMHLLFAIVLGTFTKEGERERPVHYNLSSLILNILGIYDTGTAMGVGH